MKQMYGPRERILYEPLQAVSSTELMMALLGSGSGAHKVSMTARRVVRTLERYEPTTAASLQHVPGIGEAQASRIMAALALAARFRHQLPLSEPWQTTQPQRGYFVKLSVFNAQRREIGSRVYQDESLARLISKVTQHLQQLPSREGAL